ncbi:putative GTPase [Halodesulfurarchaeum formicicum]|uniref:Putative GTPase n=2 Tax=Halodesulfurarchaeum formicicum TaxID=1873524 RepID=A0A1D8S4A6_9EURY|nr:putative GTPase [Halodesulfurarchaeum formicicum]
MFVGDMTRRTVIMGAAGRDFHDFNVCFRDDPDREVVAFTRAPNQNVGELPDGPERVYPARLAGEGHPDGIPIVPEADLESVIESRTVDEVVFSYSDVSHEHVMNQASRALAAGADFHVVGQSMMLQAEVPVIAVDAVRTGCGKSSVARKLADILGESVDVAVVREPMPYGDAFESVSRFEALADLDAAGVTIEEREEYEHHLAAGHVVFAGVDYGAVLDQAQAEADVIVWDGGNNELPFFEPDLHVVLADPLRPGHEIRYHPGETNLRLADYLLINKENSARAADIQTVVENAIDRNPDVEIIHADSVVTVPDPTRIEGQRVLAVEDGPTVTHGGAASGAALIAAEQFGAAEIVDPRPGAVGSIARVFERYDHLGPVLPAMGYSPAQIADLEQTIANVDCDLILAGTPIDLGRLLDVDVPIVNVRYDVEERGTPTLRSMVESHAEEIGL